MTFKISSFNQFMELITDCWFQQVCIVFGGGRNLRKWRWVSGEFRLKMLSYLENVIVCY